MGILTPSGFGPVKTLDERASWVSGKFLSPEGNLISSPRALEWLYQRRSFGSVKFTGKNDGFDCTSKSTYTLTFGTGDEAALQRAGRYVPRPYLTSITTKNQGSGDISDIAMWDISFEYVVYSQADFNAATTAFMIPGNFVDVTFGWNNGFGQVSIKEAVIYNFGWTYNLDGSWTCTASALAKTATAGGFVITPSSKPITSKDASGAETEYFGIGAKLQAKVDGALKLGRDPDTGGITNDGLEEGQAKANGPYGVIKIQKEASSWEMVTSFGSANEIVVSFVQLKEIVSFLVSESKMAPTAKIVSSEATFVNNFLLKSADPSRILMPSRGANYKETGGSVNDFSAIGGTFGKVEDIWISTGLIIEIENKLLERKKEGEQASYTVHQFMSQLLKEIETETGSVVNCYLQSDPQSSGVKTYTIVNRHNDIGDETKVGYTFKTLTPNSIIKGISMSSNLDAEMSAIAYTGGSGKYPSKAINNVFNCISKADKQRAADAKADADAGVETTDKGSNFRLKQKISQMGNNYNSNEVSDFRSILREHFMTKLFPSAKSIPYSINLSVTFDGVDGIQFFNTFTVDNLPGGFGDVFFAVGEIEHSVSDGNWDTTIVGYMMINT